MSKPKETGAVVVEKESGCCKRRKRQKILEAAARAFASKHYHKVRTEDIAELAGVGKGTLFRYFENKEALFVATLAYGAEVASAEIDRALAGLDEPGERLETICELLAAFYQQNDCFFHLMHHHRSLQDQPAHAELHERQNVLRGKICEIIRAGQGTGCFRKVDPVSAGRLLFGMLRTALRSPEFKDRPPQEISEFILGIFLKGVGKCRGAAAPPEAAPPGGKA